MKRVTYYACTDADTRKVENGEERLRWRREPSTFVQMKPKDATYTVCVKLANNLQ